MFEKDSNRVMFHGTASYFPAFNDKSLLNGCATEPNNRLGVWLTEDAFVAAEYAEIAGAPPAFEGVLVIEVSVENVDAVCCNLIDFVGGDLSEKSGLGRLGEIFALHAHTFGDEFDRGQAFAEARKAYIDDGVEALWVDSGETPILAVFDPGNLSIRARLTSSEAKQLAEMIEDAHRPEGDLDASTIGCHIKAILAARSNTQTELGGMIEMKSRTPRC